MKSMYRACLFGLIIAAYLSASVAWSADKKSVLLNTNQALYNLKAHGLDGFNCNVVVDWDAAFNSLKVESEMRENLLPNARNMKVKVTVGPSGAASVSHEFGQAPSSQQVADRLRQLAEGLDQILGGFFQTWSQLMINTPLAGSESAYQMEETADGYRLLADDGNTHVVVSINRDFVIYAIEAKTPAVEGVVRPHFITHEGGLIVDSYVGEFKINDSSQRLSVDVRYQDIGTFVLPRSINVSMVLPQGQLNWPMTLDGCQVKQK